MSHPSRALFRALRLAAIVALLAALSPGITTAADPIALQARTLLGGRFEAGGWVALSINLANDGAPVSGSVSAEGQDGRVLREVELPAGSRKQVTLYLRPATFARTVPVTFLDGDGRQLGRADAEVRVLERQTAHVLVVGDGAGNLRPQLIARASAGLPEPIAVSPADLPERPEPLRGIETVVWAGDSSSLGEAQRLALERWIAAGGQLVVVGGPDWQARTSAFSDMLPVTDLASVDGVSVEPLAAWVGDDGPEDGARVTLASGRLRPDAVELIGSDAGSIFATIARGAGRVTWIGVDLATAPFRSWAGAAVLWSRVIPDDRMLSQYFGGGPVEEDVANAMTQVLSNIPALEVPPAELLAAVLAAYVLLIGPVSYLVLRRLDRRELAWITAPVLVLLFSASSYGIGVSMRGSDVILNEVAVVRSTPGGSAASVSTYVGLYSPTRTTYDLRVDEEALLSGLQDPYVDPSISPALKYDTVQGRPSRLLGLAVAVSTIQAVRSEATIAYTPSLEVTWGAGPEAGGTVRNAGDQPVEDVAVVAQGSGVMVGTLEPGEAREFSLPSASINATSASDQVYGFAVSQGTTEAQRRIQARRQVIDMLVGYGAGWGGKSGGGTVVGPLIIGWRVGTSPVLIDVEQHSVARQVQMVEVLSGRPGLGHGHVALAPAQLAVNVLSTAGQASADQPGYVTVGNGEAVFSLTLPLEAANLVPSEVTLLAGQDPGAIYFNQGNFSATLPDGFRLSVYDVGSGEWTDVGDLSSEGRFVLPDPSRVVDPAGRILVRISASDVPAEIGQMQVFVGATVAGVI